MNQARRLCLLFVVLLALVGLAAAGSKKGKHFDLEDVQGRYVSAEIFLDTSSVQTMGGVVTGPIYVASAGVLQADGQGNVCGEVDGFYGYPGPGSNTGPTFYHGQYTVGGTDGRVVITTCSDASTVTGICQDATPCPASAEGNSTRLQVGYIQDENGNKMDTVSQFESGYPDSTGFVVHARTWSRASTGH